MSDEPASAWAVVVAAGEGRRMRRGEDDASPRKPFLEIAGRPMILLTLESIARCGDVDGIVLALAAGDVDKGRKLVESAPEDLKVREIVAGGARRQDTVARAVAAVPEDVAIVAVHDGARPFATPELFTRAIEAARRTGAACVALPCHETIKRVDEGGIIRGTVDRSGLAAAQTPQVFRRGQLLELLETAGRDGLDVTDDTALYDSAGMPVEMVEGERANIKITTPEDLTLAEAILAAGGTRMDAAPRVGAGYDIHPLVEGRRLVVCGVELPSALGADGHSDADVGAHAVIDALLGATALGDIGRLFPDTDAKWKDADSMKLLATVVERVRAAGFAPRSVDVTIFLESPKLAPHVEQMRTGLADVLGIDIERVGLKAKTMNRLGPVGEGRAAAAQATVVVT